MKVVEFFNERRFSQIEEEFPDKNIFPLYYTANKTEVVINPGDGLFIPSGWFHFVFSSGDINEAVNFWYQAPDELKEGERNKDAPIVFKHDLKELNLDESTTVEVSVSTSNIVGTNSITSRCKDKLTQVNKTIKEFYEEHNPYSYVVQSRDFKHLDEYRIRKTDDFKMSSVWLNFGNVYTHLHYDLDDNYLCQIKGTKRILLFPPEDRHLLYMWNPYPLDVISQLETPLYDTEYIHVHSNFIDDNFCKSLIENGVSTDDNGILVEKYYSKIIEYHNILKLSGVPINMNKFRFEVIKTSDIDKVNLFPQFAHLFVMLEDNTFKNKYTECHGIAGQVFIFPNTYTFKWWLNEGLVLAPVVIEEEDHKPTSPKNNESLV